MGARPKGCTTLWNRPCEARECLLPYCREPDFNRADARAKLAKDKVEALAAWKRARASPPCRACKGRGYYLENFADNYFTPCGCAASVGAARPVT